jgi:hypothetical protein
VMVSAETGTDGSSIRVVSAHYDVTGRWALLAVADNGHQVGDARCTQNLRVGDAAVPQVRSRMLVCWRTAENKSVVTVAVSYRSSPQISASLEALDRQWDVLG